MIGTILYFDKDTKEGEILGVDNNRYYFHIGEWLSNEDIQEAQKVYYDIVDNEAQNIMNDELFSYQYTICLKIDVSITNKEKILSLEKNY
jgi:hypothetical protein